MALGSVELAIANIPNPLASVKSGNNLTYKIFVLNLSANTASNVVVTDTLPANTTIRQRGVGHRVVHARRVATT